jgi:hypothetical protein
MKETRSRIVPGPSMAQTLLTLVVLFSVLPLYGLYLQEGGSEIRTLTPLAELKSAAVSLKRVGAFKEASELFWRIYENSPDPSVRLEILQALRELYQQERNHNDLLRVLYLIQALDPSEERITYRKQIYDVLGRLGKDKDASLFLNAQSGLKRANPDAGSSTLVVAQVKGEEIYYRDVEKILQGNAAEKQQRLLEFIVHRILKSQSLELMKNPEFLSKAEGLVEELRVAEFLKQKLKKQETSEFDLKNYFQSHFYQWNYGRGFLTSHLMLENQMEAEKLLAAKIMDLKGFEAYAKVHSKSLDRVISGSHSHWIEDDSIPQVGKFKNLFNFLTSQKKGEISHAFQSRRGIHFFWIRELREPKSSKLEDVYQEVASAYQKEFEKDFKQGYFRDLIRENQVRIYSDRI